MIANIRTKSEAIVRLAKARIKRPAQQHIHRRTVAVRRPEIAQRIEHQPERIDLSPGVLLDMRAVDFKAVTVARIHFDAAAIAGGESRVIVVAVVGIKPAIEPAPERAGQPVGVFLEPESAKNDSLP